eukprot:TRINITY_DN2541_c0_g1_i1.p1 TRINITY_DN2541_c0_g1~~TRINITY_DN2541_c0_g1_i1.p1  ORF type:complete len:556 (+),score=189.58 TRINITY_DN2541_c0_g1_i1:98-1669(+)
MEQRRGLRGVEMRLILVLVVFSFFPSPGFGFINIEDYGAVAGDNSNSVALSNTKAIEKAFLVANSSQDRTILVPEGKKFYIFNVEVEFMYNVTLQVDGILLASNNITFWEKLEIKGSVIYFANSSYLTLQGKGVIDGQGYDWWWYTILSFKDFRPHMILMRECSNILIHQLKFLNSPQFHLNLNDVKNVVIRQINIHVDVTAQARLLLTYAKQHKEMFLARVRGGEGDAERESFGEEELSLLLPLLEGNRLDQLLHGKDGEEEKRKEGETSKEKLLLLLGGLIPTFPLNTDGIDPAGSNVLIEDVIIQNFDDAVAVKPLNSRAKSAACSQNILVRNATVIYGVGMTIGSVPPNLGVNCIRNVTFTDIRFRRPIKAIYLKTNPGEEGTGVIDQILYKNLQVDGTLWQPIWLGPQQQRQPGTKGTGCSFLYPIVKTCPTQPRINITNIIFQDITMVNSLLMPGVVLCDPANPCKGVVFKNVTNSGRFVLGSDYVCLNAQGSQSASHPVPPCFSSSPSLSPISLSP